MLQMNAIFELSEYVTDLLFLSCMRCYSQQFLCLWKGLFCMMTWLCGTFSLVKGYHCVFGWYNLLRGIQLNIRSQWENFGY